MKTDASVRQLQEIEETARVRQLPWSDVLHAVLARDNHATLITRDAHFQQLADVVESLKPENVS
jgi:predicted nucleic acid-binding protein